MTRSAVAAPTAEVLPWSMFRVRAHRVRRLSPHLVRVTLRGTDPAGLADLADNGYDQRIKLILPPAGGDLDRLPAGADWYRQLRAMPEPERPIVRTYTVRAVHAAGTDAAELDVDMVLHGVGGPASAWVSRLLETAEEAWRSPALQVAVLGPDSRHPGPHGGLEFLTSVTDGLLVAGDETALPAIAAILERLPEHATGTALIEVPTSEDAITLAAPQGVRVHWLPRNGAACGDRLTTAATRWRPGAAVIEAAVRPAIDPDEPDVQEEILWEVPDVLPDGVISGAAQGIRAWVAGEAAAVRAIRRHLVGPCGLPRSAVAFMGYWRVGHAEG